MNAHSHYSALVVDGDAENRNFLATCLNSGDLRVSTAVSEHQAIEHIQSKSPDIVISELFLPTGEGFNLLRQVKRIDTTIPVIVMSGQGRRGDVIEALRLGAADYLYKPFETISVVQQSVDRILKKRGQESAGIQEGARRKEIEAELDRHRQALTAATSNQRRANDALKTMLAQREIERGAIEQTMVENLKRYVYPYLDELERGVSKQEICAYATIIRSNIEQLIAPMQTKLNGAYMTLTPTEIKVADLIRQSLSTKSIADILKTSPSTVEKHRINIRKKLNILNTNIKLNTHLNSLA